MFDRLVADDTIELNGELVFNNGYTGKSKNSSRGVMIQVMQYSLTESAYTFWNTVENQTSSTGQFFDPVESQANGNITCETNPKEHVYGYFGASSITYKNKFFFLDRDNSIISHPLDTFPNLNYALVSFSRPEFWFSDIFK